MLTRQEIIIDRMNSMFNDWYEVDTFRVWASYYRTCSVDEFIKWTNLPLIYLNHNKFYIA